MQKIKMSRKKQLTLIKIWLESQIGKVWDNYIDGAWGENEYKWNAAYLTGGKWSDDLQFETIQMLLDKYLEICEELDA